MDGRAKGSKLNSNGLIIIKRTRNGENGRKNFIRSPTKIVVYIQIKSFLVMDSILVHLSLGVLFCLRLSDCAFRAHSQNRNGHIFYEIFLAVFFLHFTNGIFPTTTTKLFSRSRLIGYKLEWNFFRALMIFKLRFLLVFFFFPIQTKINLKILVF